MFMSNIEVNTTSMLKIHYCTFDIPSEVCLLRYSKFIIRNSLFHWVLNTRLPSYFIHSFHKIEAEMVAKMFAFDLSFLYA